MWLSKNDTLKNVIFRKVFFSNFVCFFCKIFRCNKKGPMIYLLNKTFNNYYINMEI